ncbi:helix-turn-helix transcriptional regulator [butyrate-producing bacterium]|jgi:transcriptional regulator with XRE-family HTH domain|nr:helix-turn-helix transcriptional regulator [Clostridium sp. Marseille-P7770]MBS7201180.1 helix-turn-helix transcriptional regulator [butyrate-producing bacterium]DAE65642.1 MAG TPA: repressor protein [Caudoviricetes sp.]
MTLKDRVKKLAQERGISLPALEAELGFGNSTIVKWDKSTPNADKLNAVAKYFDVTMDYLLNGNDDTSLTTRDERDISKIIEQTKEQLLSQEGLMFDGDPASPEAINSILDAMQIGMEMAKKKNKEKYTPKKYKKD